MSDSSNEAKKKKQKSILSNILLGQVIHIISITFYGLVALWQVVSFTLLTALNNNSGSSDNSNLETNLIFINTNLTFIIILGTLLLILLVLNIIRAVVRYKYGLKNIVRQPKPPEYKDIITQIRKAKNEIKIIVYHGENLLKAVDSELVSAINKPKSTVSVKMLVIRKDSKLLEEVWELEERDKHEIEVENNRIKIANHLIEQIKEKTKHNPHRFDCLSYNTQSSYSIIIVDNKWAWWTPHHPGVKVEDTTSMILSKQGGDSIILECIDHFERLWSKMDKKRQCEWRRDNEKCPEKQQGNPSGI